MIFSKQLGSLDGRTAQDDIRYMANHIRRMQEELEYRLAHLDSQNITEIDMGQTKIYSGNVELLTLIKDNDKISSIQQTVTDITATVADLQTGMATVVRIAADGVTITNAAGSALEIDGGQIKAGSIKLTGTITWDDLTTDAFDELQEVAWNASDALAIADGDYDGGTFISGTSIYSPTIYANEFNVYPARSNKAGSFNLYAEYDDEMMHFLEIEYYQKGTSAPTISFNSPCSAYANWSFGYTRFYGTVDFSGCDDVIW